MDFSPGLHKVVSLDVAATAAEAASLGYKVFILPAHGIFDKMTFFDAVRATLPLNPPVHTSWDALDDSLWEGLYELTEDRILILWPNARVMSANGTWSTPGFSDFQNALDIFEQAAATLGNPKYAPNPKDVVVIVEIGA